MSFGPVNAMRISYVKAKKRLKTVPVVAGHCSELRVSGWRCTVNVAPTVCGVELTLYMFARVCNVSVREFHVKLSFNMQPSHDSPLDLKSTSSSSPLNCAADRGMIFLGYGRASLAPSLDLGTEGHLSTDYLVF